MFCLSKKPCLLKQNAQLSDNQHNAKSKGAFFYLSFFRFARVHLLIIILLLLLIIIIYIRNIGYKGKEEKARKKKKADAPGCPLSL